MFPVKRIITSASTKGSEFAVEFPGGNLDDRVDVSRDSDLDAGTSPFAISTWVKCPLILFSDNQQIVGKGMMQIAPGDDTGWGMGYQTFSDYFLFECHHYSTSGYRIQAKYSADPAWVANKWLHIAATRTTHDADGTHNPSGVDSHYKIFVNGKQDATSTVIAVDGGTNDLLAADKAVDDNNSDFRVGMNHSNSMEFGPGQITDVAYYKGEILPEHIQKIYSSGMGDFNHTSWEKSGDLTLWWKMGDGTERGSGSTIYDMSTNSYNGTVRVGAKIVAI